MPLPTSRSDQGGSTVWSLQRFLPNRRFHPSQGTWLAFLMVAPALLVVVGIYLYPAILMLLFSMAEIDVATFSIKRLIGWQNYLTVITGPNFGPVMLRTIYFATVVALLTSLAAFPIALLLNQRFPGRGLVRVVVLLPWAIPPIVSGVMWGQIFHADFGLLNGILRLLGLPGETIWLGDATLALHTRGGPAMGTTTLNFLVYQQAFQQTRFGQAAASAYLLCLVTVGVFALLAFLRWRLTLRNER